MDSQNQNSERRRTQRLAYTAWIEFGPIDVETGLLAAHYQSVASDISNEGVGVLVAEEIGINTPMFVRLIVQQTNETVDRFGYVRVDRLNGNWRQIGIEFAERPESLAGVTFEQAVGRAA